MILENSLLVRVFVGKYKASIFRVLTFGGIIAIFEFNKL